MNFDRCVAIKYFDAAIAIHGHWIPAQICREQICIYPKGVRQDSLTWIPAGMTVIELSQ